MCCERDAELRGLEACVGGERGGGGTVDPSVREDMVRRYRNRSSIIGGCIFIRDQG